MRAVVHCGAAWNASMAEYPVHAADETLLTFELVIAKDGFDTGILYFCYSSSSGKSKQATIWNGFGKYMGGLEK